MLRIAIINAAFFLIPFALYLLWSMVRGKRSDMPFYWLVGSGVALVLVAMVVFAQFETGGATGQYEPARIENGVVIPGRFVEPTE